jgi:hypothetical protein
LIALAATLALTSSRAEAQVTSFKFKGGGQVPDGPSLLPNTTTAYTTTGTATQLGKYTGEGLSEVGGFTSLSTGEFVGEVVFVAANGDELAFRYAGEFTLEQNDDGSFTAFLVGEGTPDVANCTGRFAKLMGGSVTVHSVLGPFFIIDPVTLATTPCDYSWQGSGTITFGG